MEMDHKAGAGGEVQDEQYLVDRVLNKRIVDKEVQYFISWIGYGKEENCWVSKADIWPGLVEEYEKTLKVKEEKKNAKKRRSSITAMKWERAPDPADVFDSACGRPLDDPKELEGLTKVFEGSKRSRDDDNVVTSRSTGFDGGLVPEKILSLGEHQSTGMVMVLMKWKNIPEPEFVPYQEAKAKCPQILIAHFQERTFWVPPGFWEGHQ